jgi:phospholipase A-2-activating protein
VSGCQDSQIRIFSNEGVLLSTLRGHSKGVVSFSWTAEKHLVSGSWDGAARVWNLATSKCIQTLGPHENGVQVLVLANGQIATTSTGESVNGKPANFKLRLWDANSGEQVGEAIQDHQGSIRSITALPAIDGFATTGNDGTVILRTMDGTAIDVMQHPPQADGGPPFVFGW